MNKRKQGRNLQPPEKVRGRAAQPSKFAKPFKLKYLGRLNRTFSIAKSNRFFFLKCRSQKKGPKANIHVLNKTRSLMPYVKGLKPESLARL